MPKLYEYLGIALFSTRTSMSQCMSTGATKVGRVRRISIWKMERFKR